MAGARSSRSDRFVDKDGSSTVIDMSAGYRLPSNSGVGFMFFLDTSIEISKMMLEGERSKNRVLDQAMKKAEAMAGSRKSDVLTVVKIAYTLEDPPFYKIFNAESRKVSFEWEEFSFKGFWLLLFKAFKGAISFTDLADPVEAYRGAGIRFHAKKGQHVTFKQFASSTLKKGVALGFLGQPDKCTLFIIKVSSGLSLKDVSAYPDEEEILVLPFNVLRVSEVVKAENGLTKIYLEQTNTSFMF